MSHSSAELAPGASASACGSDAAPGSAGRSVDAGGWFVLACAVWTVGVAWAVWRVAGPSAGGAPLAAIVGGAALVAGNAALIWLCAQRANRQAARSSQAQVQARQSVAEAEAYARDLFDHLSDGVLLIDAAGRLLDVNPQALATLRHDRPALLAMRLPGLLAPPVATDPIDPVDAMAPLRRALAGEAPVLAWRLCRGDGSDFDAEVRLRRCLDRGVLAVLRDVTDRRAHEQALMAYREELSELAHRLLVQEKTTTQKLAQALHDQLGQTLASARLHIDAILARGPNTPDRRRATGFEPVIELLDQAIGQVRQVLVDLRPPLLEDHGLAAALDNEVALRAPPDVGPDVLIELGDGAALCRWPEAVEYGAFMVAREALSNAQQHAGATLIRIVLGGEPDRLLLEVIDDGAGIAEAAARGRPGHLGIVGMRERATAIEAAFSIGPAPKGGTRVGLAWRADAAHVHLGG